MLLKKSHIASISYAINVLKRTGRCSRGGKALDELKSHISRLEHCRLVMVDLISQGYLDFENFETISRKEKTGGESRFGEDNREKPQILKPLRRFFH